MVHPNALKENAEHKLSKVKTKWFKFNKLLMNYDKTELKLQHIPFFSPSKQ